MKNLTFKAAMLKGSQPTVNRQSTDGQSQRHCKQTPLSKRWKVLTTLVLLFTLALGNAWGADPKLSIANPDQIEYSQDGVYVTSPVVANAKMGNQANQKCFYVTSTQTTASLNIFSKLTNIKSISFDMVRNTGSSSLGNAVSLYVSKGDAYTIPTSTDFSAKRNNSDNVTSLENVQAIGNNVTNQVTNISVTFTSNVKAIEFRNVYSSGTYVRNLVVTYESGTLPDTYLKATMLTSANDAINMDVEPTGVENASITANTDVSKKAAISEKNYCKMDGTFTINLGKGKTFVAGDQIIVDVCASALKKQVGITIDSKTINTYLANTIYSQLAYVVKTGDGIIGEQTATFTRSSSDTYIHSVSVLRAPATATTYTLTLNSAGGSIASYDGWTLNEGVYTKSGITSGTSVALLALTKSGYRLTGWKDGDNADYTSPVTVTGNLMLTAQWAQEYAVSFAAGAHGTNTMDPAKYIAGETVELPDCGFVSDDANYVFDKWAISGVAGTTEGNPGDEFAMPAGAVTITAQWREIVNRTITLDANGGTIASYDGWDKEGNVYSKTVTEGTEVSLLAFTKSGLQLMFFRDGDDNEYSSSVTLNSNLNLKAIWGKEKEVEIYYWEGKSGGATERGGEAVTVDKEGTPLGTNEDVNATNSTYYTLRVKGKPDYSAQYLKITTDKAVKTGDKITFTGYINKDESKDAALLMKAGDKVLFAETTSLPNIAYPVAEPGSPEEREYTITTTGVDATVLDLMRNSGHTGTNCFVTKLVITGTRLQEVMEPAAVPSISVQPADAEYAWNATVAALTVTASVTDGGTLSYQWYKAGEPATKVGTNSASYTPTESGTYYVVVTNSKTGFESKSATSSNAVITIAAQPSYKVAYYDGATKLGEEDVKETESPADYADYQAKALYGISGLYTFNGWYSNSDLADEHKIANVAALAIGVPTNIYGKWTRIEAQDVNLEDYATTNLANNESTDEEFATFKTWFTGKGYVYSNLKALDKTTSNNGVYSGLKTKSDAAYVAFNVPANKRVTIKLGNMAAAAEMYINGVKDETQALTGGSTSGDNFADWYYDVAEASTFKLQMKNTGTCVVKAITIGEIPAVSDDATLSDLTLKYGEEDAATITGFVSSKYVYNVVMPYGTTKAELPIVDATATQGTKSLVTINQAKDRDDWKTVIRVQAEDRVDEHDKYYEVRFIVEPKQGVSLIKVTIPNGNGNTQTIDAANITGYIGGTATQKLESGKHKLGSGGHFIGMTLAEGTFQENDLVVVNVEEVKADLMRVFKENTAAEANVVASSTANMTVGDNYVTLGATTTNSLYLRRGTNEENYQKDWNPFIGSFEVQRYMAPFIESFEIEGIGELAINPETKAITASVPSTFDVTALTPTIKAWANGSAHLDKSGAQNFTEPVTYKVTSDYAEDGEVTYTVTITKVAPSATPTITTQPVSANYVEGASINALTVVAESTAGELSYQWQVKNGLEFEDIDGATAASYTPTVSAIGSYIYRVVVTNTEESKPATSLNSNEATIVIAADPSCATFVGEIADPTYEYTNSGVWTIYNASSSGKYNESHVFDTGKNFENVNVNVYKKERCVMIFEKDMKQVRFYSTGNTRDWATENAVQVSEDKANFLAKQSLTYSTMAATTSMDNSYAADGKSCILIANGDFEAGKVYWFAFNGTLQVSRICAVEADPKADAPVFNGALSDEAICSGNSFATLDATASPVTSYAWYKDGVVIDGAEAETYTPTEAGTYYCIATNAPTGYRANSVKSAEAVLSVNEAASVTMANVSGKATASIALNAVATGANPHYAWFTCDDAEGNNAVAIAGAADAASYAIPTPVATQYYKVVVTTDCGSVSAVALVTLLPDIVPLADVTESTVWDWAEITARADGSAIDEVIDNKNHGPRVATANGLVLANYVLGGGNWDKIEGNNNAYAIRNTSNVYYQGASLHMHTTKGGILKINARNDGSAMKMKIGSIEFALTSTFTDYVVYVPAGDVTIENVPETAGKPMRVKKIVFNTEPDYTRDQMLGAGVYGTLCVDHNVPVAGINGATFYELQGRENTYGKLVFDEVVSGELTAGKPYVFQAHGDVFTLFYGATKVDNPVNDGGMYGTFEQTVLSGDQLDGVYYFAQRALWSCDGAIDLTIPANRAYVKLSEIDYLPANNQPAPGRRRVTMAVNGEKVATGVGEIEASETPMKVMIDGQLFIIRGEKMFDATGRLVK